MKATRSSLRPRAFSVIFPAWRVGTLLGAGSRRSGAAGPYLAGPDHHQLGLAAGNPSDGSHACDLTACGPPRRHHRSARRKVALAGRADPVPSRPCGLVAVATVATRRNQSTASPAPGPSSVTQSVRQEVAQTWAPPTIRHMGAPNASKGGRALEPSSLRPAGPARADYNSAYSPLASNTVASDSVRPAHFQAQHGSSPSKPRASSGRPPEPGEVKRQGRPCSSTRRPAVGERFQRRWRCR